MAREKTVEITPKTNQAKERIGHHGNRWLLKRITDKPYTGAIPGIHYGIMSRDGQKFLWIRKDDPEFSVREL